MKKLEPKFIALHNMVARLDQAVDYHKKPQPSGVKLTLMCPSETFETGEGVVSYTPAESIEVYGSEQLLRLSDAIADFCGKNQQMVDKLKAGPKGSAE